MKNLLLILVAFISNYSHAAVLQCSPADSSSVGNVVVREASVDLDAETKSINMKLENGRSVSASLVPSNLGPNALSLNQAIMEAEGIDATVVVRNGQVYLLVSDYLSMSVPQQLICN